MNWRSGKNRDHNERFLKHRRTRCKIPDGSAKIKMFCRCQQQQVLLKCWIILLFSLCVSFAFFALFAVKEIETAKDAKDAKETQRKGAPGAPDQTINLNQMKLFFCRNDFAFASGNAVQVLFDIAVTAGF